MLVQHLGLAVQPSFLSMSHSPANVKADQSFLSLLLSHVTLEGLDGIHFACGGHISVFGDICATGSCWAWQGGLLHGAAHLALCRGTAAGLGTALAQMSLCAVPGESHSCFHPLPFPPFQLRFNPKLLSVLISLLSEVMSLCSTELFPDML